MSIVVAVKKNGAIALASDSQISFGPRQTPMDNHQAIKFRKVGKSYLASVGWALYDDIFNDFLARYQSSPKLNNKRRIFSFFNFFWRTMREKYSYVNNQANGNRSPFSDLDAQFLIVNNSGIFYVGSDMSVVEFQQYYAIGSGSSYSIGALYALYDQKLGAAQIAKRAAMAATTFDIYCGGDIHLRKMKAKKQKRSD